MSQVQTDGDSLSSRGAMAASLWPPERAPSPPFWRRRSVWLQVGAGAACGALLATAAIQSIKRFEPLEAALVVVAIPLAFWAHLLLHEAGHAIAGVVADLRFVAGGVGPLRLERRASGWHVYWSRNIQGIGGFALLLPKLNEASRFQQAVYLLGGPLTNLTVAAALVPLALPGGDGVGLWNGVAAVGVSTGLFLGLINLVPFLVGGWSTDGRQLLQLIRNSDESRAMAALGRLAGLAMLGVRPRDWPVDLHFGIELKTLPQGVTDAMARCQLAKALDEGRLDDPRAHSAAGTLAKGFWGGQDGIRQMTALLLARWALESIEDLDLAEAWCALSEGSLIDITAQRLAIRAWIALGRRRLNESRALLEEAHAAKDRIIDEASRAMLADDLSRLSARHHIQLSSIQRDFS